MHGCFHSSPSGNFEISVFISRSVPLCFFTCPHCHLFRFSVYVPLLRFTSEIPHSSILVGNRISLHLAVSRKVIFLEFSRSYPFPSHDAANPPHCNAALRAYQRNFYLVFAANLSREPIHFRLVILDSWFSFYFNFIWFHTYQKIWHSHAPSLGRAPCFMP